MSVNDVDTFTVITDFQYSGQLPSISLVQAFCLFPSNVVTVAADQYNSIVPSMLILVQ